MDNRIPTAMPGMTTREARPSQIPSGAPGAVLIRYKDGISLSRYARYTISDQGHGLKMEARI